MAGMSASAPKKPPARRGSPPAKSPSAKPAAASRLRDQTRRVLGKHYRAKYGVK